MKSKIHRNVLRGTSLNYNAGIQTRYVKDIKRIVDKMIKETNKVLVDLLRGQLADDFYINQKELASMDSYEFESLFNKDNDKKEYEIKNLSYQGKILLNALKKKYDSLFKKKSQEMARKMLDETSKYSSQSIKKSIDSITKEDFKLKSGLIKSNEQDIYRALLEENVNYITSISDEYYKNITGALMRSISEGGKGLPDLVPEIERSIKKTQGKTLKYYDEQAARRAKNIGLDQTRKAFTAINKQKMLNVGAKRFEWSHSYGGQHPRKSHIKIDGQIFSFDNLENEQAKLGVPENDRGLPGFPPYCRCKMIFVFDFDKED